MPYEKDPNECGALWEKTSAKGVQFLSGVINGVDVVCFKAKPVERGPTWRVLKSQPRDTAPTRPPQRATPPKPAHDVDAGDDARTFDDDDIAF